MIELHILNEIAQPVELFLGLAGESGDKGGAQGDIRHTLPDVGDGFPQGLLIARTVHPAEDLSVTVLDGQIQTRHPCAGSSASTSSSSSVMRSG